MSTQQEKHIRDDLDLQVDFDDRQIYVSTTIPAPQGGASRSAAADAFGLLGGSVASLTSGFEGSPATFHDLKFNETRGNELIPRSQIPKQQTLFLGILSCLFLIIGVTMSLLGALIQGSYGKDMTRHCPSMWWTGVPSLFLFVLGAYTCTNKSRRYLFIMSIGSVLLLFMQTAVMGAKGNFSTALYSVWPLHVVEGRLGLPLCHVRHGWCFCQDYYHGVYSDLTMHQTNYVTTNTTGIEIKWKDTGFKNCSSVSHISKTYYVEMCMFALLIVISLALLVLGLLTTVSSSDLDIEFKPLEEETQEPFTHVDIPQPSE